MRLLIILLTCYILFACGKTGALYLPEEADTQQSTDTGEKAN
jgi:predicted small lipoprotein YifL